jgi:hypothetical protein
MRKKIQSAILLTIICLASFAQEDFDLKEFVREKNKLQGRVEHGYIITLDNERKPGFIITSDDARNSKYIYYQKYKGADPEILSVKDILGYGFESDLYNRFIVEQDTVFMKKLNKNKPFLYYSKSNGVKQIYIEGSSGLKLLSNNKDQLIQELRNNLTNCDETEYIHKAIYNKTRLSNILEYYGHCNTQKLPYFKFGVFAGSKLSEIQFKDNTFQSYQTNAPLVIVSNLNFDAAISYYVGLYADILFSKSFNVTFHPELEYANSRYKFMGDIEVLNSASYPNLEGGKLILNVSYFNFDLYFRYNTLKKNTSLIFDFGPILSYNIPKVEIESTEVEVDFNNFMLGIGGNIGVETPVFDKYNLTTGLNANYLFSSGEGETTKFSTWNVGLFVGFGF